MNRYQAIQAQLQNVQRRAANPVLRAIDAARARINATVRKPGRTYGSRMRRP